MDLVRWTFQDSAMTYTLEVNPKDGGSPRLERSVSHKASTAPDGVTTMFEGRRKIPTYTISGAVYSQAQYYAMIGLFAKRNQLQLTDDLGRVVDIYITKLTAQRVNSHHYPWKHTYTVDYLELNWA